MTLAPVRLHSAPCTAAPRPGPCSCSSSSPAARAAGRTRVRRPASKPATVERFLPRDAQAAIVVQDLGTLGEKLARFQNLKIASFVAQLQNSQSADSFVSSVMRQIGVDLRSRQAIEKAGIDQARARARRSSPPARPSPCSR